MSLHYNRANSYLFVNGTEIIEFKARDSEIVTNAICFGNISKEWSVNNMKKTELNWCFYDFSVGYNYTAVDDIRYSQVLNQKEWDNIIYLDMLKKYLFQQRYFSAELHSVFML